MPIAQAQVEHLTLVTRDAEIPKYDVETPTA
jgi:PIN domain nuclease of toxin-antitoxin system